MDFEFTDEQSALRATVRAMLERHCSTAVVRELVERGTAADALWAQMTEIGIPGLIIPEVAGGLGQRFIEQAVVLEELGRAIAPGPYLATVTQFTPLVRECGSAQQQDRFLRPVAAGEGTGTLALSGPSGGWLPEDVALVARPAPGGAWILDGTLHHVVDGASADEIAVVARLAETHGEDGVAAFVVPRHAVKAQPVLSFDASRPVASLTLRSAGVEADRVLGEPGACGAGVRRAVEEATVALALEMVGSCQSIFDIALAHAKAREQFGVAIGSFQAIKHKFADMLVALERARATAYFAALTIAEEDDRRSLAASMAKASAGDCQRLVAQEGIQIMGGMGYTWAHDMHLFAKRAKMGELLLGTSARHRQRVAGFIGLGPPQPLTTRPRHAVMAP